MNRCETLTLSIIHNFKVTHILHHLFFELVLSYQVTQASYLINLESFCTDSSCLNLRRVLILKQSHSKISLVLFLLPMCLITKQSLILSSVAKLSAKKEKFINKFIVSIFKTPQSFKQIISFDFVFLWDFCEQTSDSLNLYLILMPFLRLFSFCVFLSNVFVLALSFYIAFLFYYYPLRVCLFSNERQEEDGPDRRGKKENLGRIEERKIVNKIYYIFLKYYQGIHTKY